MLKRKIKFPLVMDNNVQVRTIDELMQHFHIRSVLDYYFDGRLRTWLDHRYYKELVEKIDQLANLPVENIPYEVCSIFGVEVPQAGKNAIKEYLKERQKVELVHQWSNNPNLLKSLHLIAFSQEELDELLQSTETTPDRVIYLLGEQFEIIEGNRNIKYIGINKPTVYLKGLATFSAKINNISLTNTLITAIKETKLIIQNKYIKQNEFTPLIHVKNDYKSLVSIFEEEKGGFYYESKRRTCPGIRTAEMVYIHQDIFAVIDKYRKDGVSFLDVISGEELSGVSADRFLANKYEHLFPPELDMNIPPKRVLQCFKLDQRFNSLVHVYDGTVYTHKIREYPSPRIQFARYALTDGAILKEGELKIEDINEFSSSVYQGELFYCTNKFSNINEITSTGGHNIEVEGEVEDFVITDNKIIVLSRTYDYSFKNGFIVVYDLDTGALLQRQKIHDNKICLIKAFDDQFVTICTDRKVKVWDSEALSVNSAIDIPNLTSTASFLNTPAHTYDVDLTDDRLAILFEGRIYIYE
ncbi:hypothetical protein [Alkalihalobacterium chitinilyticum]|uniref:WD40 repeat domain-containing protein n=1 Tax=Alkalihalobacterium chitinilyticum TaxID=2980103 RepID=A0ABT5VH83_9BACI|nr:hypothetical protein [Alkalihalobacterium chitinilyticum]MDE5413579.1 hypothetical protein [Alkalihalobacterium chitinilyticum]